MNVHFGGLDLRWNFLIIDEKASALVNFEVPQIEYLLKLQLSIGHHP